MGMRGKASRVKELSRKIQSTSLVSYESSSDSECQDNNWDFSFLDSDLEEVEDGKRLTLLVRKTYLGYLHRVLSENFSTWFVKSENKDKEHLSNTDLSMYAMILERKALKNSLLANLYQRSMVQVMKNIRRSTQDCTLYSDLKSKISSFSNKYCDKGIQTQTSCIFKRLPNVEINHETNSFNQNSLGSNIKDIAMVQPLQKNNVTASLNNDTKPVGATHFESVPISTKEDSKDSRNEKNTRNVVNPSNIELDLNNLSRSTGEKRKVECFSTVKGNHKPSSEKKVCKEPQPSIIPQKVMPAGSVKKRISIEERLSKLTSLFGDSDSSPDCEIIENPVSGSGEFNPISRANPRPLCVDWHKERISQICNLNKILIEMSSDQRTMIEKRFKDLFGTDADAVTNISSVEMTVCRRRIADIVVPQLTRYYLSCRIGSRELFKLIARHITNHILKDSYAPDPEEVIRQVDAIFETGKSIMTPDDLSIVTK